MSETPDTANTIKIDNIDNLIVETNLPKDTSYILKALEAVTEKTICLREYCYYEDSDQNPVWDIAGLIKDQVNVDTIEIIKKFKYIDTIEYWDGSEIRVTNYFYYSKELDVFLQEYSPYDSWNSCQSYFFIVEKPVVVVKTIMKWKDTEGDLSPEEFQKRIA